MRSQAAGALWHDLARAVRDALQAGASMEEAAAALRDRAAEMERMIAAEVPADRYARASGVSR